MTTYYDRGTVRITDRWLLVGPDRYRIDHLQNLCRARGPADRLARRAGRTAAVSVAALAAIGPLLPLSAGLVLAGILVALPATVAGVRARWHRAAYQLWADYRGAPVRLYQTRDDIEFGRVSRALVRASALSACRSRR